MERRSLLLLFLCCCLLYGRPKKDVLFFKNGDRMTCEIKKLDSGKLLVSAPYTDGTITIDWREVERIETDQSFTVEDLMGNVHTGSLQMENKVVQVKQDSNKEDVPQDHVMTVTQLEASWLQRFHGSLDGGLIYTKSNDQTQLSFNAGLNYTKPRWQAGATAQVNVSNTAGVSTTNRRNVQLQGSHSVGDHWFTTAISSFLRSDEQSLELRSTVGGGFGYWLGRTDRARLATFAGVVFTRERYAPTESGQTITNNPEGLIGARFRYFRWKVADLTSEAYLFPNLTTKGRVRLDTNTTFRFQLVKDLYWNFGIYSNYDSKPPQNARGSDYGVNTGLGYSF